jgi:acetyl/propionyl-CoA carboxylase alpha subunit
MGKLSVRLDGQVFEVELPLHPPSGPTQTLVVDGEPVEVTIPEVLASFDQLEWMIVDGRPLELVFEKDLRWVRCGNAMYPLEIRDAEAAVTRPISGDGRVKAPIPGQIVRVFVEPGRVVEPGEPLLVLEAMKMENEILAPRAGTVAALNVAPGQGVALGELLLEIE